MSETTTYRTIKAHHKDPQVCLTCGNHFHGKLCNECGEKKFKPEQLSIKAFIHQTFELFTHLESKVLKSIWLLIKKPGYITKENLRGVRVPFAKPMQLFIIVNLIFYFANTYLHRGDYIPSAYDNFNSVIYTRPGLTWLKPVDMGIGNSIKSLREQKINSYDAKKLEAERKQVKMEDGRTDTASFNKDQYLRQLVFISEYDHKVAIFSKTLIFLLIPVFAGLFFIAFNRKLKYYGASLVLATHFLAFNLLFYTFLCISMLPWKWFHNRAFNGIPFRFVESLLYNKWMEPFSTIVFGIYEGFEALHIIVWGTWPFFCFQKTIPITLGKKLYCQLSSGKTILFHHFLSLQKTDHRHHHLEYVISSEF